MNARSVRGRSLLLAALVALPSTAWSTTLSFEGFPNNTVITDQFPGVRFSSTPGQEIRVSTQPGMGFGDNFICTATIGGSINCLNDVQVDFLTPVNGLSFYAVGDNTAGVVGLVDVYENKVFAGTVEIVGDAKPTLPSLIDLTGFQDVSSIYIHSVTDSAGLGYDLFNFEPVPEPISLALGALGLFGLRFARRRTLQPRRV